ncbi:MAG: hypothetical protein H6707_02520 [Deltaproteobacteria bacterium]|nr:hypothetical protein [Deltaproteobacteria bacterium]
MNTSKGIRQHVDLRFSAIKLPPVRDILVLGRKHPNGKAGVMECFRFIAPDEFEMIEIGDEDPVVEAVLINKRILKRMNADGVLGVLRQHVFPFISSGEAINVDFEVATEVGGIVVDRP